VHLFTYLLESVFTICNVGSTLDSRLTIRGDRLMMSNLKRADTQMFQCNASNIHGYLVANVYLNVQGNTAAAHRK